MPNNSTQSVSISKESTQAPLSKGQKAFNNLIKQIERKRAGLMAWENAIPPFQQKYTAELVPLLDSTSELQTKIVLSLDEASARKNLTKGERRKIAELIVAMAAILVPASDDTELKAIYNKHSRTDYDADEDAIKQEIKSVLEDTLGVDLGDDFDFDSPEDMFHRARGQINEQDAAWWTQEQHQTPRKKTAKQLANEARQQAEAQQLQQSIREIYRKLASALHPDREVDPTERERKTTLMQRVNQAYEKNNLLQLLELQLELEHIDQAALANLSESRLKHYNKILQEQVYELDTEILRIEDGFRAQFGIPPFAPVSVKTIMGELTAEIADARRVVRELKKDLLAVQDPAKLKTWLKGLPRVSAYDEDFDFWPR